MADKKRLLIYGANGYTGRLISRLAVDRGLNPILGGRNEAQVKALADELGMQYRCYDLSHANAADKGLEGIHTVLHCAGPFQYTSAPMIGACLRMHVHYLDITGEISVFEAAHDMNAAAVKAGILLMPGVGFDVVPSDCLAKYLWEQMPDAVRLELAMMTKGGRLSHGTAITVAEGLGQGSAIRKNGVITATKSGYTTREIDFGTGPKTAVEIPWGDVSTAYYSTGIPDIRVYNALPKALIRSMRMSNWLAPILSLRMVKNYAIKKIKAKPAGPDEAERKSAASYIWGEVTNASGQSKRAMLTLPEGYTLTAMTAVEIAKRVSEGQISQRGFQTPSMVFGSEFISAFQGVVLTNMK